jgi:hypothetical protein
MNATQTEVVPEKTLTLEQLELCVRGELFIIDEFMRGPNAPYPSRRLFLGTPVLRQEYEAAKVRGWCRMNLTPWEKFCKLSSRPHAYLYSAPNHRCVKLHITAPDGRQLERGAVDRIYALLHPNVRKGRSAQVSHYGIYAEFPKADISTAEEMIATLLDLLLENLCDRDLDCFYSRSRAGVSEYNAGAERDYSAWDALHSALEEISLGDVPVACDERNIGRKEQARLARELFKSLGLKKISVTTPNYSMAFHVDVHLPEPSRQNWEYMRARVQQILDVAFPNHYHHSRWHVQ